VRVVALLSESPLFVLQVEQLGPEELGEAGLAKRFPRVELRQITVEAVAP
jgi:hypothetical protein